MFNVPFLPRAIRVCKVYVSFQHSADDFVFGELCPIVSSYSQNLLSIRKDLVDDGNSCTDSLRFFYLL